MLEKAKEEFLNYTNPYREVGSMCILKINHTLRVVDLCERIAKELNLSEEDIELAKLCGLLHDIARFEQWKKYNTLADSVSIDHGDLGNYLLKDKEFLRKFNSNEEYDDIILKSVKYHNKYKIPDNLTEKEKLFTNIVRDADKIDILYLYITGEVNVDVSQDEMCDKVFNSLLDHHLIEKCDKKTKADTLAVTLAFIFDINFVPSIKIIKENNYYDKEIDIYLNKPISENLKKQLEEIKIVINNYIDERID